MQIKKKLMAPALMIAAIFSGNAARAQTAPLPEAPAPQRDAGTPQRDAMTSGTPIEGIKFDAAKKLDLSALSKPDPSKTALEQAPFRQGYDFRLPPQNPDASAAPNTVQRVAIFADRHMINGEQGYSIAGEVKIKDRFSVIAGTRDYGYQIDPGSWNNNGMNLKPEIPIWTTENSRTTIRPKGRGIMIGFKMTIP